MPPPSVAPEIPACKTLEEAQGRLVRTLDAMSDFVGMIDRRGVLHYLNSAGRRILGWTANEPVEKLRNHGMHPEWATERIAKVGIPAATREGTWTGETAILDARGNEIPVSQTLIAHPESEGPPQLFSTVIRPLTDRRVYERPAGPPDFGKGATDKTSLYARDQIKQARENPELRVNERTAELARTYAVIQDRALQQETVAHLGQRALAGAGLEELFDEAVELVRKIFKIDLCTVLERTTDGLAFVVRSCAGWPEGSKGNSIPTGYRSQAGYTLLIGKPVIVDDLSKETRFRLSQPVRDVGVVSGLTVIIPGEFEPFGVLAAMSSTRCAFTQDDAHFLQSIANILTAAIDRQHADEKIRMAQEQAEAANRAKSVFLSRMSHELRTPLNAILGFTELLELDSPTPRQAESIFHISRAGQNLLSLINKVLDIARIDVGQFSLSLETVKIPALIESAVDLVRPVAARGNIEVIVDPSCNIPRNAITDKNYCQQVVLQLLSNAVKFNRAEGRVTISCRQSGEEKLRIVVADTGPGIAPEKMNRLFVPFERLGAEVTDVDGIGIGLALSQRIAAALHGTLGVASVLNVGSKFWLDLPSTPIDESEAPENTVRAACASRCTLLYVEDQPLNVRLVEHILAQRPEYKLISAAAGKQALELAAEHHPSLILLDLHLPDMTGEEVLKRLKEDEHLRDIPVVMVSGEALPERVEQLREIGARDYLTKPYRATEFFSVIDNALISSLPTEASGSDTAS